MGEIKSILKKTGKVAKKILRGTLALYLGSQAYYAIHNYSQTHNPSPQRAAFQEKYGFPVKGWESEIENDLINISIISAVIDKEQHEKPFQLDSLRFDSGNFFKKPIHDQIENLVTYGAAGYYFANRIVLSNCNPWTTTHHEIKHDKTMDVFEQNPEFREKWDALAQDADGNSLYLNATEQAFSRIRGLGGLVDKQKQDSDMNEKLGFVSSYARTNIYEDIAEVGEEAERIGLGWNSELYNWLFGENKNDKIREKFKLAQEYDLIPREFCEYIQLYKSYYDTWGEGMYGGGVDTSKAKPFMEQSEEFLKKYPNTIYETELRSARGGIMMQQEDFDAVMNDRNPDMTKALAELKKGLTVPFKDMSGYMSLIDKIRILYIQLKDDARSEIYDAASRKYWDRFHSGDVNLSSIGVNDFLKAHGELQ